MNDAVLTAVKDNPGIHFRALQRLIGCSTSTVDHHVRNTELIDDVRIHNYRRLFHDDVNDDLYFALAALNHDTQADIIAAVHADEPVTQGDISDDVGLAPSTTAYHTTTLVDDDVLTTTQRGRTKYYHVSNTSKTALRRHGETLLEHATKGFIDLWD